MEHEKWRAASEHNARISFIVLHSFVTQVVRLSSANFSHLESKFKFDKNRKQWQRRGATKDFKIPKKWLERLINSLPCGNSPMSTTCDNNNSEMDAFSLTNYRRDSTHCFYQNRGKDSKISVECFHSNALFIHPVIQPLLTGKPLRHLW